MKRSRSLLLPAIGVVLALLVWSREATLGTYGSYTLVRRGYTVAQNINVGSHSDHSREAEIFRSRESAIDAQVKPLLAMYDQWYGRVREQKHPYVDWLGALDTERTAAKQWDYKARLPGPIRRKGPDRGGLLSIEPVVGAAPQIYLHMRPDSSELARGRALLGFALAQVFLGDGKEFTLPTGIVGDGTPLAQRAKHAAGADSFAGQPRLVAAFVFEARARQEDLARLAEDKAQPAEVRLLARLCLRGLRHEPWDATDWQLVEQARSQLDLRTLWTWVLIFAPTAEHATRESELRQRIPLSEDQARSFYESFVKGSRD